MLRPSTYTRSRSGSTRSTLPRLPRSLPEITITSSPALIRAGISENLRGQRHDLHEVALAQLARYRTEDAGTARIVLVVDQHGGVFVEADVRAVAAAVGLLGAHDDGGHDLTLADRPLGDGLLDGRGHHVPDARVASARPAFDPDHQNLPRTAVIGHAHPGLVLDHSAFSTTWTSRQRLVRDSGRDSRTITVAPIPASP